MAWLEYVLIEPIDGGSQQIESSRNFLKWKRVLGGDKKPIEDQRESFGGRIWRIVDQSADPKQWNPKAVAPLLPISLPVPKLPPEAMREVEPAPVPALPDLDPAGDPVRPQAEVIIKAIDADPMAKKPLGRPKKATA